MIDSLLVTPPPCVGDSGSVTVTVSSGTPPYLYSLESIADTTPAFNGLVTGAYVVTVTDAFGCVLTAPFSIPTGGGPAINIIDLKPASCNRSDGAMTIGVSESPVTMILDDTVTSPDGHFAMLSAGVHYLTISDTACTLDTLINVPSADCRIFIPNVFSPNGDGINDLFGPVTQEGSISILSFVIYDRWGDIVFSCADQLECAWDGKIGGKPAPTGVYVYRIEYGTQEGGIGRQAGDVTVVR